MARITLTGGARAGTTTTRYSGHQLMEPYTTIRQWYNWFFGDSISSALQNPIHVYQDTGLFSVTLIAWKATSVDTLTRQHQIHVLQPPPAQVQDLESNPYDTVHIGGHV